MKSIKLLALFSFTAMALIAMEDDERAANIYNQITNSDNDKDIIEQFQQRIQTPPSFTPPAAPRKRRRPTQIDFTRQNAVRRQLDYLNLDEMDEVA